MQERRGLTRRQLANRLGVGEDQIADLASGHTHAAGQLRLILMRYFDCQFEDLFEVLEVNPEL